jgi:hypothetical protein
LYILPEVRLVLGVGEQVLAIVEDVHVPVVGDGVPGALVLVEAHLGAFDEVGDVDLLAVLLVQGVQILDVLRFGVLADPGRVQLQQVVLGGAGQQEGQLFFVQVLRRDHVDGQLEPGGLFDQLLVLDRRNVIAASLEHDPDGLALAQGHQ